MSCWALCGPLRGISWCGNIGTLLDNKTALRAYKWPLQRFDILGHALPCWIRAQKCRLLAVGRRTSGGKLLGSIGTRADTLEGLEGTKNPPQAAPGRAVVCG